MNPKNSVTSDESPTSVQKKSFCGTLQPNCAANIILRGQC